VDCWVNVGIKGSAIWPNEETKINFGGHELLLKPATRETEQSIHINLKGISNIDALILINRFLSVLSWCDDQPMENRYGWSGTPVPGTVPKEARISGSIIASPFGFPFYRDIEKSKKTKLALALFREARTINSTPFEFLGYFKILNIFWKDKYSNGQNALIEGIRNSIPELTDDLAIRRLKTLHASESDVPKYLYESGRCAIAHAFADPIVDPDDVSDLRRLSEDIHIIKAIAEHLISAKLGVSRSIAR